MSRESVTLRCYTYVVMSVPSICDMRARRLNDWFCSFFAGFFTEAGILAPELWKHLLGFHIVEIFNGTGALSNAALFHSR